MDINHCAVGRYSCTASRRVLSNISNPSQSSIRPSIYKRDAPGLENQISSFEGHLPSTSDQDEFVAQPIPNLKFLLDTIDIPQDPPHTVKEEAVKGEGLSDLGPCTSQLPSSTIADSSSFEDARQESNDNLTISFPDAVIVASLYLPQEAAYQKQRAGPPSFLDPQLKMFTITSESLESRATARSMFLPLIQEYPAVACTDQDATDAFTKLRNPPLVEHLNVLTTWKGLSTAQSKDLESWGTAFRISLNEMIFEGLRTHQGGALILQTAYHSCSSPICTSSYAAKKLQVDIDNLIMRMCHIYRKERSTCSGLGDILHSARRFVNTCDCFADASPSEVTNQHSLSGFRSEAHNASVSVWFPGEHYDCDSPSSKLCKVKVIPQLDRIGFVDLEPTVTEGSRFQLKPYIEWSRKTTEKESLSAKTVFTLEPEMSWLRWDDESASFLGEMQYWSLCNSFTIEEFGPALITHGTPNYASPHTLCLLVKATITEPCSQGASFERVIRAKVAIRIPNEMCTIGQEVLDDPISEADEYSDSERGIWDGPVDGQARQTSLSSTSTASDPDSKVAQATEDLVASFDTPVYQLSSSEPATASDLKVSPSKNDFLDRNWEASIDEQVKRLVQPVPSTAPHIKTSHVQNAVSNAGSGTQNDEKDRQVSLSAASTATDREATTNQLQRFKPGRYYLDPFNWARMPTRQPVNPPSDVETQIATGFTETKRLRTIRRAKRTSIRNLLQSTKVEAETLTQASSLSRSEDGAQAGRAYPTPNGSDSGYESGCDVTMQHYDLQARSESPSPLEDRTQAQVVFDLYQETEMRESSNLFSHMKIAVLIEAEKQRWREWKARWTFTGRANSDTEGMLTPATGSEVDADSSSEVEERGSFVEGDLYD
ncbi:MAG: hypothetical protein M1836_000731 [Candelina mexicana]|nr:MAG: hypothetical protein M1836_000731 [Candelina mexicana]